MPTRLLIGSEVLDPDVTITERYLSSALVTSHPVERGADVADHVRQQPLSVNLDLVITETPLRQPSFGAGDVVLEQGPVFRLTGSLADRANLLIARLEATRARGELVTLESARRGTIENLAVQLISDTYTSERAAQVSLSLVQVVVADARTVAIPETLQPRGKKKRDKGTQPPKTVTQERRGSLLSKGERQYGGQIRDFLGL